MRVVSTPLASTVSLPVPRPLGGVPDVVLDALVPAPGIDQVRQRLRNPETLVVTTGQQPGLFTGPLYTIYKALSAAAVARELERRWTRPVVSVFWLANDDHDFAEARWASWLGADGEVTTVTLPDRPADGPLTPMYRQPLGQEVLEALDRLETSLPASPARDETLTWLRKHYTPDAFVGGAFGSALAELLASQGVVCLDSTHPAVKAAAAPLLLHALEIAGPLDSALAAHGRDLESRGVRTSVTVGDGASLVFLEHEAGRDRLIMDDGALVTRRGGIRLTLPDLRAIAANEPRRLSPNVLLRPVVESAILPTVAYVAGPGELAYLGLSAPLYAALEVPVQLPLPRWSGVVVEPRVDRVIQKFGATLDELMAPGNVLEARMVRSQMPPEIAEAAARLRTAIAGEYDQILPAAVGVDPTLERPVGASRQHALSGLAEVEKKINQHLRRREATELAQIARARTAVFPGGKPQERVLTAAGWLARTGNGFLTQVAQGIGEWYADALAGGGRRS